MWADNVCVCLSGAGAGLFGFLASTALILIFGEIIPQALCSRYALGTHMHLEHYGIGLDLLLLVLLLLVALLTRVLLLLLLTAVVGGKVVPFVRVLIALFYVFAKPVSMALDATLGEDIGTVFTKRQVRAAQALTWVSSSFVFFFDLMMTNMVMTMMMMILTHALCVVACGFCSAGRDHRHAREAADD